VQFHISVRRAGTPEENINCRPLTFTVINKHHSIFHGRYFPLLIIRQMVKDGRLVGNVTHKFIFYTFAFPGPSQLRLLPKYKRIRRCDNCLILPTPERDKQPTQQTYCRHFCTFATTESMPNLSVEAADID
jgi:hypothetical protein